MLFIKCKMQGEPMFAVDVAWTQQQAVELPSWIGIELTGLRNWSNAALADTLMANL